MPKKDVQTSDRCFSVSFNVKNPKHMMRVQGRHPRHPKVLVFKCEHHKCPRVIYYNLYAGRPVPE